MTGKDQLSRRQLAKHATAALGGAVLAAALPGTPVGAAPRDAVPPVVHGDRPISDICGPRTPYHGENAWPVRADESLAAAPDRWAQSACVLCSNGCAADIDVKDGRIVGVRGRVVDRVNRGGSARRG